LSRTCGFAFRRQDSGPMRTCRRRRLLDPRPRSFRWPGWRPRVHGVVKAAGEGSDDLAGAAEGRVRRPIAYVAGQSEPGTRASFCCGPNGDDLSVGPDGDSVGVLEIDGEVRGHLAVAAERGVQRPVGPVAGHGEPAACAPAREPHRDDLPVGPDGHRVDAAGPAGEGRGHFPIAAERRVERPIESGDRPANGSIPGPDLDRMARGMDYEQPSPGRERDLVTRPGHRGGEVVVALAEEDRDVGKTRPAHRPRWGPASPASPSTPGPVRRPPPSPGRTATTPARTCQPPLGAVPGGAHGREWWSPRRGTADRCRACSRAAQR